MKMTRSTLTCVNGPFQNWEEDSDGSAHGRRQLHGSLLQEQPVGRIQTGMCTHLTLLRIMSRTPTCQRLVRLSEV